MELKKNYEIIGTLDSVESAKNKLKLKFKMIKLIELPLTAIPLEKMQEMQGQQIGILLINGKYWIRKISKQPYF